MFDAVHHIAYVVPDLDAALKLFRDTLHMEPEKIWASEAEGNKYAALKISESGSFLELICPTNPAVSKFADHLEKHGPSVHHVAFKAEMDSTLALLKSVGIPGTNPIISSSGWRISFLDPTTTLGVGLQLVDGK